MTNFNKNEATTSHELVPAVNEAQRPAVYEGNAGEYYYYERVQTRSALARTYLQMVSRQRKTIIVTFLLVMGLGMLWTLTRPRLYRSAADMLVTPVETAGTGGDINQDISVMTRVRSVATEVRMLKSPDLLDEAFASVPEEMRVKGFQTSGLKLSSYPVSISNAKDTDVITVEVTACDPYSAARFANQIIESNMKRHQDATKTIAKMATQHIDNELVKCDEALKQALRERANYKRTHNVADVTTAINTETIGLATLESQATQAQSELARAQETQRALARELANAKEKIEASRTTVDNPLVQSINAEIERLQAEKAQKLQEYLPTATEIQDLNVRIAAAKSRLQEAIREKALSITEARNPLLDTMRSSYITAMVEERAAKSKLKLSRDYAGQIRGKLSTLPKAEEHLALMNSKVAELQTTHSYLQSQKESLNMSMWGGLPSIMPITGARPILQPVSPNIPASLALLLVLSTLLGVGLAVFRDQLDDRIHTSELLETISGQRVLVSLPQVRQGFRGLVTSSECPQELLEQFRILRGNIMLSIDPLPQVIMVTSARPGEGKSTTVANLAATIALSGKKVIAVDCDLRHPSVHLSYGMDNVRGLSSVLSGEADAEVCIRGSKLEHLNVLVAGPTPSHPPELLASTRMSELIAQLRERYDCILLDSTPMVNLSDGTLVASQADGVIMVVSSDRARQPDLHVALKTLEQVGTPILGLVHNRSTDTPALNWSIE
ncbi:MAG: polysaccharide biosynthesis tyrosine autokinase [Armatimonadota bacterium]